MGRLHINDPGVRRAAQAISRELPSAIAKDDAENQVARLVRELHNACAAWQK